MCGGVVRTGVVAVCSAHILGGLQPQIDTLATSPRGPLRLGSVYGRGCSWRLGPLGAREIGVLGLGALVKSAVVQNLQVSVFATPACTVPVEIALTEPLGHLSDVPTESTQPAPTAMMVH